MNTPYSRRSFARLLGGASLALAGAGRVLADPTSAEPFITDFGVSTTYKDYAMLKKHGYSYIEASTADLLQPSITDQKVADLVKIVHEQGIRIHSFINFIPGSLKSTGPNADHEAVLSYADTAFQRAKLYGAKGIVFGSSGSRKLPPGFPREEAEAQFISLLKKMAPLAEAQGIEIWVEPLNRSEDNFINTQMQGAAIVDKVGHPSIGMVCDLYHVAKNEEPPEDIKKCIHHIRHCHIAEKAKRTPPGVQKYDFTPYLAALKSGGYNKTMTMECRWKNLAEQAPVAREFIISQMSKI